MTDLLFAATSKQVSLGLWICGAFNWVRLLVNIIMQFLGALAAAGIVSVLLPGRLQAETSLGSGATVAQGFFLEVILTGQLVMTIIMLAVEKSRTSFIAPLAIGLTLFVDHLIGKSTSGPHLIADTWLSLLSEEPARESSHTCEQLADQTKLSPSP